MLLKSVLLIGLTTSCQNDKLSKLESALESRSGSDGLVSYPFNYFTLRLFSKAMLI